MSTKYAAIINTPGYLPTDDSPATFDTPAEAWWHLYHERVREEQDAPCDLCQDESTHGPMGDCDSDSETGEDLAKHARWAASGLVTLSEACTTVNGPTPGYDGDHDLGIAYCVVEVEATTCEACGTTIVVGEDCPNYGYGVSHA